MCVCARVCVSVGHGSVRPLLVHSVTLTPLYTVIASRCGADLLTEVFFVPGPVYRVWDRTERKVLGDRRVCHVLTVALVHVAGISACVPG